MKIKSLAKTMDVVIRFLYNGHNVMTYLSETSQSHQVKESATAKSV